MLLKQQKTIHDLRNAIASAISCIEYILYADDPDVSKEILEVAKNSLHESIKLSEDISYNIKKICKRNKMQSKDGFTLMTTQEYCKEHAMRGYELLRKKHRIKIYDTYSFLKNPKYIYVNTALLHSVRSNIISNAENAGASEIHIHFEMKEHYITISISDNGRGMTQEEIDAIYAKKHGDGIIHGIGTSIIIDALKEHGTHTIYHPKKGKGCSIRVICPYLNSIDIVEDSEESCQRVDMYKFTQAYC